MTSTSLTAPEFYKLVLALWGEAWRPSLKKLLEKHGHRYSRQSFYNWQKGEHPVPEPVAVILNKEAKRKGVRAMVILSDSPDALEYGTIQTVNPRPFYKANTKRKEAKPQSQQPK